MDHLRADNRALRIELNLLHISMHPFVVAELALSSLHSRGKTLLALEMLPSVKVARLSEVRQMIEAHSRFSRGIGLTDAHLIASTLITPSTQLWTLDKRVQGVAEALGVAWQP